MELRDQEWRNEIEPPYLSCHCDRCWFDFSIGHALCCKKGGLFAYYYKELCEGVYKLASKALTPTHVHNEPLINSGHVVQSGKAFMAKSNLPNNPPGIAVES